MARIDAAHMIGNAATASQNKSLLDDPVTIGAVLRSVAQWINHNRDMNHDELIRLLQEHPEYDR